nr:uncharacterized protein LOC109783172 [Aegilops tauschii subsp. strangulata]
MSDDERPHLVGGRRFSIILDETSEVDTRCSAAPISPLRRRRPPPPLSPAQPPPPSSTSPEERAHLARRLEAALEQVRRESVRQGAALDELRRRLERRRARAEELLVARRRAAEGVERRKEQMQAQIERVLPLSRALAAAHRQVQDAKEGLSVERARLGDLQRLLTTRQQSMVAQVAALYPVRVFRDLPVAQNHHSRTNGECRIPSEENGALTQENGNGTHLLSVIKDKAHVSSVGPLTFFGWQIGKPRTKQRTYSHKELQWSAVVLGYAAHIGRHGRGWWRSPVGLHRADDDLDRGGLRRSRTSEVQWRPRPASKVRLGIRGGYGRARGRDRGGAH